jgi:hydrogenase maturation protein HypF
MVGTLCDGEPTEAASERDVARGVRTVALTGGVFQNRTLLEQVEARLVQRGFHVLTHHDTPPNDAGLALGQALIDAARRQS